MRFVSSSELNSNMVLNLMREGGTAVVAFVGKGALRLLPKKNFRLVCNIFSAGTNPYEIEKIQMRFGKDSVRTFDGLHAKVYTSKLGALVGSANLSANGLGFNADEVLPSVEAGVLIPSGTEQHAEVERWADEMFTSALPITDKILNQQKTVWDHRDIQKKEWSVGREVSFGDLAMAPSKYIFAFYNEESRSDAKARVLEQSSEIPFERYLSQSSANWWLAEKGMTSCSQSKRRELVKLLKARTVIQVKCVHEDGPEGAAIRLSKGSKIFACEFHSYRDVQWPQSEGGRCPVFFFDTRKASLHTESRSQIGKSLKKCSESRLWERWLKGELANDWFGKEWYLRGELWWKMVARAP